METTQPIVLIVDDSPESIDVLRGVLGTDYRVCVAINGTRALEIAPSVKPDVILLDVMMPEMDGWQVLKILKGDERTRNIPVAMLSARAERRDKMIGLQEGAESYIAKPFSTAEVVREVTNLLNRPVPG